jgi:flagellar protein FlgJ
MPDAPGALKPWRHATGAAATSAANPVPAASTAPAAGNVAQHPAAASGAGGLSARAHAFVQSILPSVKAAAAALQVSPVAILAQAALETGWGSHAPGNNLFGVKAGSSWQGSSLKALTTEVSHGVAQAGDAVFRAYDSAAQSVGNYAQVLLGSRYDGVRGHGDDIAGFANALQRSGYATDPDYARKLLAVAQSPTMREALAGFSDSSLPPP